MAVMRIYSTPSGGCGVEELGWGGVDGQLERDWGLVVVVRGDEGLCAGAALFAEFSSCVKKRKSHACPDS